jgi:Lantibiotic dehydratase, N terminus
VAAAPWWPDNIRISARDEKSVMEYDWALLPVMVLRSAGFPWQMVEQLGYAESGRLLDELIPVQQVAAGHAANMRPIRNLSRGQKSKLRNFRPMPADEAVPQEWRLEWNRLTVRLADLREQLAEAVDNDSKSVEVAIERIRADERFNDAVVCSSPAVHRDLSRGVQGTRIRRQIASYAQRLASKSETMSFFGPINYATLDPRASSPPKFDWLGHKEISARQAHTAARVNDTIQELIVADDELAARLVPRRKTSLRAPQRSDLVSVLVGAADGARHVAQIAESLGRDLSDVLTAFRAAVAKGRLTHDLAPPSTTVDPLRWTLDRVDGPVRTLLAKILALLESYPAAAPERKYAIQGEIESLLPPIESSTSGSRFYNDRVIVHEAAVGTAELQVSGPLATDLRDAVAPVLDLFAYEAEQTRKLTNRAIAQRLGSGTFPLVTALKTCADVEIVASSWLSEAVAVDTAEATVDIAGLVPPSEPAAPVLCSIDVLVATPDIADYQPGHTPIVLGDIHDAALLTPWALQFHPDSTRILAMRDETVRDALGSQRVLNVISRRTTGLPPLEFPGVVLELGGCASPGREHIGIDQLWVHSDGTRAELRSDVYPGESLLFHNGELDSGLHTALALPRIRRPRLPDLPYMPRLTWGNVVLSRRRWTVPSEQLIAANAKQAEVDRLLDVARFAHELGLPRQVFAKSPNERKPIYVDMTSPELLKALVRLAGTAAGLTLSEVLPTPHQAWLRDGELRFAAELRCIYTRGVYTGGRR